MKNRNFRTNRPLFLGMLGNTLCMTLKQMDFADMPAVNLIRGGLLGFTFVALAVGLWDMNHERSLSEHKRELFARLRGKQ